MSYNKPIFQTQNENTGNERYSGVMMWPGGEFPYQGKQPTYYKKLDMELSWYDRINTMMTWIVKRDKPGNLVLGYFEKSEHTVLKYGASSKERDVQIKKVDNTVKYLLDSIRDNKLGNIMNLIILSDHGMTTVTYNNTVFLDNYVSNNLYKSIHNGPNVLLYPNPGKMYQVYNNLKKGSTKLERFKVYKPKELPRLWHLKNSPRLKGLIYVSAIQKYSIWDNSLSKMLQEREKSEFQIRCHGYDNTHPEMGALFIASGPIFKKNFTPLSFENIILYRLISYVMNLDKSASKVQPHGLLSDVAQILTPEFMYGSNKQQLLTKKEMKNVIKKLLPNCCK